MRKVIDSWASIKKKHQNTKLFRLIGKPSFFFDLTFSPDAAIIADVSQSASKYLISI